MPIAVAVAFSLVGAATGCALPLAPYVPGDAAAAVTATVSRVRGVRTAPVYSIRRAAIVWQKTATPLPDRAEIAMTDFVFGTCGAQSPWLRAGDKIVLYYTSDRGRLIPSAWRKL